MRTVNGRKPAWLVNPKHYGSGFDATQRLWEAEGYEDRPCAQNPSLWDPIDRAHETDRAARSRMQLAVGLCRGCPVIDECREVRDSDPSQQDAVLAGEMPVAHLTQFHAKEAS